MVKRPYSHIIAQKTGKELDSYMCFFCNKVDKGNHGHHIVFYSEGGEASVKNIMTLCPDCHREYTVGKLHIDIGRF